MKRKLALLLALFLYASYSLAIDIPDAPLEPEDQQDVDYQPGSLVEFYFLPYDRSLDRFPSDPPVSMMYDTEDQVFSGAIMQKDETFKTFLGRSGMLRWNTYLNVKKPGIHVFTSQLLPDRSRRHSESFKFYGYSIAVNGENKLSMVKSGALETFNCNFRTPGLYKLTISLWMTFDWDKLTWQDMRLSLKVREPGSMGMRQVTKKDLLTPVLDSE